MKAYEHSSGAQWFTAGDDWSGVPAEPRREDCHDSPEAALAAWRDHMAWLGHSPATPRCPECKTPVDKSHAPTCPYGGRPR